MLALRADDCGRRWANGRRREVLLRVPDMSFHDGLVVKPHPPAIFHSLPVNLMMSFSGRGPSRGPSQLRKEFCRVWLSVESPVDYDREKMVEHHRCARSNDRYFGGNRRKGDELVIGNIQPTGNQRRG